MKQLNDISFEGDSGDEEGKEIFEDVRNVQRLPQTILTEENLKVYLTRETEKLDLEHSYWLKDVFLDKVGRMAPNLRWLSLRRLKISNRAFTEIAICLKQLERLDISDCTQIQAPAFKLLLSNNKSTLQQIQASNTPSAVTNEVMDLLAWTPNLTFLDISHARHLTDEGAHYFKERALPIKKLFVNGLTSLTGSGLADMIQACTATLRIFEGGYMDQEGMVGAVFCNTLAHCFELEEIDLSGDVMLDDNSIMLLPKGELKDHHGKTIEVVGLQKLRLAKLNGLTKLTDHSVIKLAATSKVLEHLELTKCEQLTEYAIDSIIKQNGSLVFLDLNGIPAITQPILDGLR